MGPTLHKAKMHFPYKRERERGMASEWRKRERRERVRASQLIVVSVCFTMLFAL